MASTSDLVPGKMMGVEAGGKPVLLVNLEEKYYAIGNRCTHAGCKLSNGVLKAESVQCPCHRSVFDIKSGKALEAPAKQPEPVFQVKVEGNQISVDA